MEEIVIADLFLPPHAAAIVYLLNEYAMDDMGGGEEIATRLGCCKLTPEVLEGNTVAQAAYEARGFAGYELDPKMGKAMFWQKKLGQATQTPLVS